MPIYLVLDPIIHDGDRHEIGSNIELTPDQAASLPVEFGGETIDVAASSVPATQIEQSPLLNANTATVEELTVISGLGESMANSIIDLRPIDDLSILSEIPRFRDEWLELMEV